MAGAKVADVDVVANARAIWGVVVVAKDVNSLALAHGNLSHVRNQVVWNACRIFSDEAGLVSANRIEVSEQDNVPFWICGVDVGKNLLDHPLGPTVRVGRVLLRALLGQREAIWVSVNSGRARENN